MKLYEIASQKSKGSYAGVRFDQATIDAITQFLQAAHLPNATAPDKLHSTLLYSRKFLPDYQPLGEIAPPLVGKPTEFVVWETSPKDPGEQKARCLVMKYDCPDLVERHHLLMKQHGATYDYDEYIPHLTLSYDIGDTDVDSLPQFSDYIDAINIVEEYGEPLDLDWATTNGVK
jgi:hypothetical protein